jgi:hypothetical protein
MLRCSGPVRAVFHGQYRKSVLKVGARIPILWYTGRAQQVVVTNTLSVIRCFQLRCAGQWVYTCCTSCQQQRMIYRMIAAPMPPPKHYVRKLVSLPPKLAERVADYRFERRIASETAAIRELIEKALDAAEREQQKRERKG